MRCKWSGDIYSKKKPITNITHSTNIKLMQTINRMEDATTRSSIVMRDTHTHTFRFSLETVQELFLRQRRSPSERVLQARIEDSCKQATEYLNRVILLLERT